MKSPYAFNSFEDETIIRATGNPTIRFLLSIPLRMKHELDEYADFDDFLLSIPLRMKRTIKSVGRKLWCYYFQFL